MPLLREVREDAERAVIAEVLYETNGIIARAAQRLGLTRPTLYVRLWHYWPRGNWPARRHLGRVRRNPGALSSTTFSSPPILVEDQR